MTACSMPLPVISFGIIFTIYGNITRKHLKRKAANTCRIIEMFYIFTCGYEGSNHSSKIEVK